MFFFSIYPVEVRYIEEGDDTCIENDHDGYIKDGCENEDGYRYLSLRLIKKKMKTWWRNTGKMKNIYILLQQKIMMQIMMIVSI